MNRFNQRSTLERLLLRLGPEADYRALVIVGYILVIGLAELIAHLGGITIGAIIHALLIVLLVQHYIRGAVMLQERLLPILALFSLTRLLSLVMPIKSAPQVVWHLMIGIPIVIGIIYIVELLHLEWSALGYRNWHWREALFGGIGLPLGLVAYLVVPIGIRPEACDWLGLVLGVVILFGFSGVVEELLYRGLLQYVAQDQFGRSSLYVSTAMAVALAAGAGSWVYLLLTLSVHLLFGWWSRSTGSIWGTTIAHGLMSALYFVLLPASQCRQLIPPYAF